MSNLYVGADQTYTTVKAALQAAQDGDTIIVSAGDYTSEGALTITKELTLKAAEGATVIVDHVVLGSSENDRIGNPYSNMTISGLTIKPATKTDWQCTGVWQNSFHINTVTIENCTIDLSNSPEKSIGIKCNRGGGYVKNINITGNTIIATGESANFGITIGTQSGIENITVTGNTVTGSFTSTGIHMDLGYKTAETYTVKVSGNTVEAETGRGIYIAGINNSDASVTVSENNVSALSSAAAAALQLAGPAVESVVVSDNNILSAGITAVRMDSLTLGDAAVTVTGNDILAADPANGFVGYTPAADSNNTVSLIPTDSAVGKIFVNNAWAELEAGATVLADGSYRVIGTNAFAGFTAALQSVTADTTEIKVSGNVVEDYCDEAMAIELSRDLVISGGSVTWNDADEKEYRVTFKKAAGVESDVAVTFNTSFSSLWEGKKSYVTLEFGEDGVTTNGVNGVIAAGAVVTVPAFVVREGSTLTVAEGGKLVSSTEAAQVYGELYVNGADGFVPANAAAADRQFYKYFRNKTTGVSEFNNVYMAADDYIQVEGAGEVTFNNALVEVGANLAGEWSINPVPNQRGEVRLNAADAVLNLNDSILKAASHVKNSGTINIADSTFIADGTVASNGVVTAAYNNGVFTNSGKVNVSGESTLVIRELTGNTITALDGAVIKDSVIKSSGSVELVVGETGVASTVTFKGANDIAKISVGNGDKIVVGKDASLVLSGSRSGFGNGATWDIDGNIADVKALSAEEKAGLTASLDLVGGLSVTGGGNSLFTVDNAYFTFGGSAITTKNTNQAGGTLTMSFTNSYVKSAKKISINPTASGYDAALAPEVELNFKDSVVELNNFFINNHAKSTVTIENTNFTATAFGNVGVVSVSAGSVVNFSMVNNALNDWVEKGGLNAGSITIDASDLNIANKGATVEFYNVGTIVLTNGATLTLDKLVNAAANELTGSGKINQVFADMVGSITIDASSSLTAGILAGSGTITIDAEGFVGTKTLVDVNSSTFSGEINIINNNGGARLYCAEDGDIILSAADMSTISVDSAWAGIATGTEIGEGSGKYMGINAFADVSEAMAAVAEKNTVVEIADGSILTGETGVFAAEWNGNDAGEVALFDIAGKEITWSAEEAATLKFDARYVVLHGEGTLNIDQNINIDYEPGASGIAEPLFAVGSFWTNDKSTAKPTVNLNGKISAGDLVASVKVRHGNMYVSQTGAIDAQYGIRVRDGLLDVTGTGKDAAEAQLKSQRLEVSGDSVTGGAAKIILKDTYANITYGGGRIADRFDSNTDGFGFAKGFEFINSRVVTGTLQFFDTVSTLNASGTDFTVTTFSNKGIMDFADSTLSISNNFTNDGSMSFAGTSITVGGAVTNNGTLNFTFADIKSIAKDGLLLIDAAKASDYGTVTLNGLDAKYEAIVINGDLYAFDMSTIYVDAAYSTYAAGAKIADGIFMGINAFASLEDLNTSVYSAGDRTVVYTYAGSAAGQKITVANDPDTTGVQYSFNGTGVSFSNGSRTHTITEAGVYTFDFAKGDYNFAIEEFVGNTTVALPDAANVAVNQIVGDQEFTFSVADNTTGTLACSFSGVSGAFRVTIYRGTEEVASKLFNAAGSYSVDDLAAGEYSVVFSAYGKNSAGAQLTADFDLTSAAVSATGDIYSTLDNTSDGSIVAAYAADLTLENWVGTEDKIDWFQIEDVTAGTHSFNFELEGNNLAVVIYDANLKTLSSFTVTDKVADGVDFTRSLKLAADSDLFIKVTGRGADSDYSISIA